MNLAMHSMNLDKYLKIELKSVTKFLFSYNFSNEIIYEMMLKSFATKTPSLRTIQRWTQKFKAGDLSIIPKKKNCRTNKKKCKN